MSKTTKNEEITFNKSDIKLIRGSKSKAGIVYTVAFATEKLYNAALPAFTESGAIAVADKPILTRNGLEVRFKAKEESLVRSVLRVLKKSGPSYYRGESATYIKKASEEGIKYAKKLVEPVVPVVKSVSKKAKDIAKKK